MDSTSFTFANSREVKMRFYVEPEGMGYEIPPNSSIEISISTGVRNGIIIDLREDALGPYIQIWPEKGNYEVSGLYDSSE